MSKLCGKNKFAKFGRVWPLNIKSINSLRKYSQIIESEACVLKIFVMTSFLPIDHLISSGMCSTPKLSKCVTLLPLACKSTQWVPID